MRAVLLLLPCLGFAASWGFVGCTSASEVNVTSGGDVPEAGVIVILDGGGGIEPPPNGESLCPSGACNYQTGAGCGTGACAPLLSGDTAAPGCVAAGTGKSGAACDANHACAPKYLCVNSTCQQLCCGRDWTACDTPGESCFTTVNLGATDGTVVNTGAMICAPANTCDALNPAGCPTPGDTCQIIDPTGATACSPEGTGDVGQACPCKGGSLCVANGCRRLCKAVLGGGDPFCQSDEGICVHYDRDPPGVGECTP